MCVSVCLHSITSESNELLPKISDTMIQRNPIQHSTVSMSSIKDHVHVWEKFTEGIVSWGGLYARYEDIK